MKKILLMLCLLVFTGCASTGRVALLDLDFRTPEQIAAGKDEVLKSNPPTTDQPQPKVIDWLTFIPSLLDVVDGRIRIISWEWTEK